VQTHLRVHSGAQLDERAHGAHLQRKNGAVPVSAGEVPPWWHLELWVCTLAQQRPRGGAMQKLRIVT
jgi:hypothetical protein